MCGSRQACALLHVLWCLVYIGAGTIQMVAGVFFLVTLPIFKTGSNIWVGAWNILIGISCTIISSVGDVTQKKQETLLYCTFSILAVNVVNLVVLELGEWHFFMTDSIALIIGQKNLKKLVYFAHITTSLSTAVAIVTAFLDTQLTFCSMQRAPERKNTHEQVSDIEYIIPRSKSRSVAKQAQNIYSQYAQSWVFEADTPGSSKSDSPYQKLPTRSQDTGGKTMTLRTHSALDLELSPVETLVVKPTVHVDPGSDGSGGGRSLCHMKSFSRTPSPVHMSDSSSQDSNPPIYQCLERLTEPAIYRSRLNTAKSAVGKQRRQYSAHTSPMHMEGALIRPRSEIITGNRLCVVECVNPSEKVQYASLMAELQQSFKSNKDKFSQTFSPETISGSDKTRSASKNSESDSQTTEPKGSDIEFSKELEAALQLIQDLESPNTIETPSDPIRPVDTGLQGRSVCVQWRESDASDSTRTLSESVSPSEFPDENTIVSSNGKGTSLVLVTRSESCSRSSSGYSSPSADVSKQATPSLSETSSTTTLIISSQEQIACTIHNRGNSAIISLFSPSDHNKRSEVRKSVSSNSNQSSQTYLVEVNNEMNMNPEVNYLPDLCLESRTGKSNDDPDYLKVEDGVSEVLPSSQNASRWSVMARLTKKPIPPMLTPELEGAIYKPESLAYLTDLELIARHERNKSIQREIERRVHHQISGSPTTESDC